jgi:hypothetical protein
MHSNKLPTLYCSACKRPLTIGLEPIKRVVRGEAVEAYIIVVDACTNCAKGGKG